jgi:hypothetical protein
LNTEVVALETPPVSDFKPQTGKNNRLVDLSQNSKLSGRRIINFCVRGTKAAIDPNSVDAEESSFVGGFSPRC